MDPHSEEHETSTNRNTIAGSMLVVFSAVVMVVNGEFIQAVENGLLGDLPYKKVVFSTCLRVTESIALFSVLFTALP